MPDYLISQVFSLARSGTVMNYEIKRERRAFFFFLQLYFSLVYIIQLRTFVTFLTG